MFLVSWFFYIRTSETQSSSKDFSMFCIALPLSLTTQGATVVAIHSSVGFVIRILHVVSLVVLSVLLLKLYYFLYSNTTKHNLVIRLSCISGIGLIVLYTYGVFTWIFLDESSELGSSTYVCIQIMFVLNLVVIMWKAIYSKRTYEVVSRRRKLMNITVKLVISIYVVAVALSGHFTVLFATALIVGFYLNDLIQQAHAQSYRR
jgi:hypothetical protein